MKYLYIFIAFLVLVIIGYFGFQFYNKYKNPRSEAIAAVPTETVFLVEIDHLKNALQKFEEQGFWKDLHQIPTLNNFLTNLENLDSVLTRYPEANDILEQQKMIISFLSIDSFGIEPIFILELPPSITSQTVESIIKKENGVKSITLQKNYAQAKVSLANISNIRELYCFSVYKGLLISAFNEQVLEKAIDQLNTSIPINFEAGFKRVQQTAGKKVDANLYFNYKNSESIVKGFVSSDLNNIIKDFSFFGNWTETDLIIKHDELLLNGYSVPSDTGHQILNWFKQEPQQIRITEVLPPDVAWMLHFGVDDFKSYHKNRFDYLNSISSNSKPNLEFDDKLYSWIGNEMAIVETLEAERLIILQTQNTKLALENLNKLATEKAKKTGKSVFMKVHNDYSIGRIYISGFPGITLGQVFSGISNPYYICIKDYIVFSNHPEILIKLIDGFYKQETFDREFNYQSFSDNISERSNIYFYCNIRNSIKNLPRFIKSGIADEIILNKNILSNFEALALQYSFINGMFYTNIYLKYNPDFQTLEQSGWETKLESKMVSQPQIVRNHKTGMKNIIVFDELNHIYLLDNSGEILFKNQLIEKAKSNIFEIDYFKNGDIQYLFNGENYLHLIDLQGNYVEDFPFELPLASTGPLAVFDYENTKDYRLLIPLNDNKIYNFSSKGEIIEGWKKLKASQAVVSPVEHMITDRKDYIFITDEKGNMNITNRRGEGRIKIKKSFKRADNSKIYLNRTNSKKGLFLTTNTKGEIVYITKKGKVSNTSFGYFSDQHYFLYEDFTNNGDKDFIFIDGKRLFVFNKFKKVILDYTFKTDITTSPIYFSKGNGDAFLGILSNQSNEIIILNHKGLVESIDLQEGEAAFTICSLTKNNEWNILFGIENNFYNQILEKQ